MNIIMIMIDSLRLDHVGCYGNQWIETPNMDRLAAESVVFENAYPEGLPTLPVRSSLFTGNYTLTNRFWQGLLPQDVTMAEILDEYGYVNAMITDTYHLFKPNMNYHRGFHAYEWVRGQEVDAYKTRPHGVDLSRFMKPALEDTYIVRVLDQYFRNVAGRRSEEDYFPAQVMKKAVEWLEDNHGTNQPFFLHVDCFDPHEPWEPPPPFDTKYSDPDFDGPRIILPKGGPCDWMTPEEIRFTRSQYAGEVSFVDKWLGYLLDHIRELGLLDNSLVVFLSDHGHPHGDHGAMLKMGDQLYSELLRIPLFVRFPDGRYAGSKVKGLVQVVDIFPTILDILGHSNETEFMQGKSFMPLVSGDAEKIRQYATMGFFSSEDRCIRDERWSFIRRPTGQIDELYDLAEDAGETRNLLKEFPEKAKKMGDALAKVFNIRMQKEHALQVRLDVPGHLTDRRFPPVRFWKK
jgi:arylsulfatase A-like enzyme